MYKIDHTRLMELEKAERDLDILMNSGVMNWGGYAAAQHKISEIDKLMAEREAFLSELLSVLAQGIIKAPDGGAVNYPTDYFFNDECQEHALTLINNYDILFGQKNDPEINKKPEQSVPPAPPAI